MSNWSEWMNAGSDVKNGRLTATQETITVDLGGKPKMLMAHIGVSSNGGIYTVRTYDGTEVIISIPKGYNQTYEDHEIITITENGFTFYSAYNYEWFCNYYAVM